MVKKNRITRDSEPKTAVQPQLEKVPQTLSNTGQPAVFLYCAAGVLAALGQWQIFSSNVGPGMILTLVGVACFLLGRLGKAKLLQGYQTVSAVLKTMIEKLESPQVAKASEPAAPVQPALLHKAVKAVKSDPDPKPALAPLAPVSSTLAEMFSSLRGISLTISKPWLIKISITLIVLSQPLLYLEKFLPALILLIPGVLMLVYALVTKEAGLHLGQLDQILKFVMLAMPGVGLMVVGHWVAMKNLETNLPGQILGFGLIAAGIFMILALIPKVVPDPDPSDIPPLETYSDEAHTRRDLGIKLAWVAGSLVCFFLAAQSHKSGGAFYWSLAGIGVLGMSFPWSWSNPDRPGGPDVVAAFAFKYIRLILFGVALVLGYRGQSLIAQEQLFPGLYHFAAAALALMVALKEPAPGSSEIGREKPLKWYWEVVGLLVVLGVGFWLRFYKLDVMPYGVECDEAGAATQTVDVLLNQFSSVVVHPCGRPIFMLLPSVVAYKIMGFDSIGVRFAAMFFGVVSIFLMYLMARHFYGPRIALAVSALFAASRWHMHFSRFGWSNTLMLVLLLIGFYLIVKGLEARRKWYFVVSGMAFGLVVQTETAARMVPIICFALLVYLIVSQRHFFRRNWQFLLALMLGVWLTGAGIFMYWLHRPDMLYKRVYEVSLFSEDPNAPRGDYAKALIESTKWSLTQLNWHGDYRQRHNGGMTGEPVADFWTAILFALGLGYSIFHWKRLRHFIPLVWFFGFMGASIFAIEAPQSHRAFGVFPAVFLLIAAFMDRARRLLAETLGKPGVIAAALVFVALLVPITRTNAKKYFDAYPAFDTNVTAAAKYMGRVWPQAEHVVMTAYTWFGHWPFKLYARDVSAHLYYAASEAVPIRRDTKRDICFTFIMEYPPLLPTIQWFYPNGKFQEEDHPKYGLQFKGWGVTQAEIQRTRGLTGRYYANANWEGAPEAQRNDTQFNIAWDAKTWPLPGGTGSVSWEGTILIPHEGTYTFYVSGTDYVEMTLGTRHVLQAGNQKETQQSFWLAGGLHRIRVRARHTAPAGRLSLAWSCAQNVAYYLYDDPHGNAFSKQPLAPTHVFTYPEPVGLLSAFYGNALWKGQPRVQKVEPVLFYFWQDTPYGLGAPYSVDFKGWINIPKAGEYRFDLEPSGYGEMEIDGQTVLARGAPPKGWTPKPLAKNPVALAAGRHPVIVRWSAAGGSTFRWLWTPPGKQQSEVVPAWVLTPAEE
jgi:hypothetical protein